MAPPWWLTGSADEVFWMVWKNADCVSVCDPTLHICWFASIQMGPMDSLCYVLLSRLLSKLFHDCTLFVPHFYLVFWWFFLVAAVIFYKVIVVQSVHTVSLCVRVCVCGHDSFPGWTYSGSARESCRVVLPKHTSCLWKGPLPSLKQGLLCANKVSPCTVVITQSSRWINLFGFTPIFLTYSSWQYSLETTFLIRRFLCLAFSCIR